MSDFFENHKNHYNKDQTNIHPDPVITSYFNLDMDSQQESRKEKKTFYTYNKIKQLKWEHIVDPIPTSIYKDKLINKGLYILKGFIPDKITRPTIRYCETKEKFSLKYVNKSRNESSICFSFKNKQLRIYENSNARRINGQDTPKISGMTHIKSDILYCGNSFKTTCNAVLEKTQKDAHLKTEISPTGVPRLLWAPSPNEKPSLKYDFDYITKSFPILRHIVGTLIKKAYTNGAIDKNVYIALKRVHKLILNPKYKKYSGYEDFNILLLHLRYKAYQSLLALNKTDEELLNHWDKFRMGGYVCRPYFSYADMKNIPSINKLLMHEKDLDKIIFAITDFENKGALKKAMYSLIYQKNTKALYHIKLFRGYIKRDWILELSKIDFIGTRGVKAIRRSRADRQNDVLKSVNYNSVRKFTKDYIYSDKMLRHFIFSVFGVSEDFSNQALKDTLYMYYTLPSDLRPSRLSLPQLHDRLSEIHYRNVNVFVENKIPEIPDSFEYNYEETPFKKLVHLNEQKFENYTIQVPKTAKEIRDGGQELHNCLVSYVYRIYAKSSFIFYLLEENNKKYAVEIKSDNENFIVNQFYGYKNSMPEKHDFDSFKIFIYDKIKELENVEKMV